MRLDNIIKFEVTYDYDRINSNVFLCRRLDSSLEIKK